MISWKGSNNRWIVPPLNSDCHENSNHPPPLSQSSKKMPTFFFCVLCHLQLSAFLIHPTFSDFDTKIQTRIPFTKSMPNFQFINTIPNAHHSSIRNRNPNQNSPLNLCSSSNSDLDLISTNARSGKPIPGSWSALSYLQPRPNCSSSSGNCCWPSISGPKPKRKQRPPLLSLFRRRPASTTASGWKNEISCSFSKWGTCWICS